MQKQGERFELRASEELLTKVDTWRRMQSTLPSRAEAIRHLISRGIENLKTDQLTPYQKETLENIRRTAERGLSHSVPLGYDSGCSACVDLFQHILDELKRIK